MHYIEADNSHDIWNQRTTKLNTVGKPVVSLVQNREGRCTLHDCQNFICGRAYLFITGYDDFFFLIQISRLNTWSLCKVSTLNVWASYIVLENVKWKGKEVNFKPISIGIELPEVTVQPISIANRDLPMQAVFRFLNVAFDSDSLTWSVKIM